MSDKKQMKGITYCGNCSDYDWKKHKCKICKSIETDARKKFYDDCPLEDVEPVQKWIPVSERLPKPEEEVIATAIRRYKDGGHREIVTPAIYEDGTVLECDSNWNWEEIDGEWDEENDCLIIPKGWFENRHYNPECTYNCAIDDEVVAWMPLPEPYRESEE